MLDLNNCSNLFSHFWIFQFEYESEVLYEKESINKKNHSAPSNCLNSFKHEWKIDYIHQISNFASANCICLKKLSKPQNDIFESHFKRFLYNDLAL